MAAHTSGQSLITEFDLHKRVCIHYHIKTLPLCYHYTTTIQAAGQHLTDDLSDLAKSVGPRHANVLQSAQQAVQFLCDIRQNSALSSLVQPLLSGHHNDVCATSLLLGAGHGPTYSAAMISETGGLCFQHRFDPQPHIHGDSIYSVLTRAAAIAAPRGGTLHLV